MALPTRVAEATVAANSGGGNHLLLPVALGQRLLHDSPTAGFGGGIVRVEGTNLSWVNDMYPGDLSGALSAATLAR